MGCDGGTIPTRDELVRVKKKPEKKDKDSDLATKWKHCCISQEQLQPPIMSCELGRLYNKESVIEFLLDRSKCEFAANFIHLRGLKDIKELQLTDNPDSVKSKAEYGDGYIDVQTSHYICPVTGLEMSGRYRFSYIWTCGCVVSERAFKEVRSEVCHKCGTAYKKEDVICLNGTDDDMVDLRSRMDARRLEAKISKKGKAGVKHKAHTVTSDDSGASTSKQMKTDAIAESTKPSDTVSKSKSSKLSNGVSSKSGKSTVAQDKPTTSGTQDKPGGIQKDPTASKVYKSLFTTSSAAKNQMPSHWVTFNPMYY